MDMVIKRVYDPEFSEGRIPGVLEFRMYTMKMEKRQNTENENCHKVGPRHDTDGEMEGDEDKQTCIGQVAREGADNGGTVNCVVNGVCVVIQPPPVMLNIVYTPHTTVEDQKVPQ